jgi:hypothetical protein
MYQLIVSLVLPLGCVIEATSKRSKEEFNVLCECVVHTERTYQLNLTYNFVAANLQSFSSILFFTLPEQERDNMGLINEIMSLPNMLFWYGAWLSGE